MPGSVQDAFPTFTPSSPKPWEVGSVIPRLRVRKPSSINLIYLLRAMPGYERGYVLLQICCLLLFISYHKRVLGLSGRKPKQETIWKIKRPSGNPPFKARQGSELNSVSRAAGGPGWHPGQGWGGGFSGLSSCQLSLTASPKRAAPKTWMGRQTFLSHSMYFNVLSISFIKCYSEGKPNQKKNNNNKTLSLFSLRITTSVLIRPLISSNLISQAGRMKQPEAAESEPPNHTASCLALQLR